MIFQFAEGKRLPGGKPIHWYKTHPIFRKNNPLIDGKWTLQNQSTNPLRLMCVFPYFPIDFSSFCLFPIDFPIDFPVTRTRHTENGPWPGPGASSWAAKPFRSNRWATGPGWLMIVRDSQDFLTYFNHLVLQYIGDSLIELGIKDWGFNYLGYFGIILAFSCNRIMYCFKGGCFGGFWSLKKSNTFLDIFLYHSNHVKQDG